MRSPFSEELVSEIPSSVLYVSVVLTPDSRFRWQEGPLLEVDSVVDENAYESELVRLTEKLPVLAAKNAEIKGIFIPVNPSEDAYAVVDSSFSPSSAFKNLAEEAKKLGIM
jgi:hypothetical protein